MLFKKYNRPKIMILAHLGKIIYTNTYNFYMCDYNTSEYLCENSKTIHNYKIAYYSVKHSTLQPITM